MRYRLPAPVRSLVNELTKLPSIGPRSAERLAYYLMKSPKEEALNLAATIREAKEKISSCVLCGGLADSEKCYICSSDSRDKKTLCIVENPQDIAAIEESGYMGIYHVLMGSLSPLDGVTPDDLRISELVERIKTEQFDEIILALDPNVEGEATAIYLKDILKSFNLKITQLAYGIPMGGNLEYADGMTLSKALEGRRVY
ncbi:MAG: recombination protein RecR [Elusimicrobia bacterium]|nr:recombination protein RecR [Elusimicrobiota bacterium]